MTTAERLVLCVDVGSTWTKVALADVGVGRLVATAARPTTIDTDVLHGLRAAHEDLCRRGFAADRLEILGCSSAGGGLRVAVLGNEAAVTVEAGRQAALSSGGQVVAALSGSPGSSWETELAAARADLVLLSGGTDGGNRDSVLATARWLAEHRWEHPVVLAANADAAASAAEFLTQAGIQHTTVSNLVPQIGQFAPDAARRSIRALFLSHVIGGKGLSSGSTFTDLLVGPTPDVVLTAAELIGALVPGGVVVVDVGGATTDVYSCFRPDPAVTAERVGTDLVAAATVSRTVEGDLGVHASVSTTVLQGRSAQLLDAGEDVGPDVLTRTAVALALTRHAGRSETVFVGGRRSVGVVGPDLRDVELLIGSGGVLRTAPAKGVQLVEDALSRIAGPGRLLPQRARVLVDADYLLAPIGLLADRHPHAARALAAQLIHRRTLAKD